MHNTWLPVRRGNLGKFAREPRGRLRSNGRDAKSVLECGYLSRLQPNSALREPADSVSKRLLPQFHVAPFARALDQNDENSLVFNSGRERTEDRFGGVDHGDYPN